MKGSMFSDAQKAFILRQGTEGVPVADICCKAGINQATYFNWKKKYDGLLPPGVSESNVVFFVRPIRRYSPAWLRSHQDRPFWSAGAAIGLIRPPAKLC